MVENKAGSYDQSASIPLVINYDPANLTVEFVETKVLPFIREVLCKKSATEKKSGIESSDDETERAAIQPLSYKVSF